MSDRVGFLVLAAALTACASGGKTAPPPVENHVATSPAPPPAEPPPPSGFQAAMAALERFTQDMCACSDRACADRVQDALNKWSEEMARTSRAPADKPTEQQMRAMAEVGQHYGECMAKTMYSGATPPVSGAPAGP